MKRRFSGMFPFLGAAMIFAGCSGFSPAGDLQFDGMSIPGPVFLRIKGALVLIMQKEPVIYGALKKNVRKIDLSNDAEVSHPFYDTIYLASYSLERGDAYAASVIVHELHHVVFNNIRLKRLAAADAAGFLDFSGVPVKRIGALGREQEEAVAYGAQMKFLLKYGTASDIEYQDLRMKHIFKKKGVH